MVRVRSPAEEGEGKDAAGTSGTGSWPRARRYAVGEEVEVLLTGKGFRGARYEATVTKRLQKSDRYEVRYSELLVSDGSRPLREVVAACDVRPRPPPLGRELELFSLVEAYHDDGWWPGVVSEIIRPRRGRNQETRFTVTFPLFRETVELSAKFVRPRQEFVYGSWMDAQEVLRGIPQYAEGSHIEVQSNKHGRLWQPATIKKMVGCTNYVVNYGDVKNSIEVVHACFIRPPIYGKMKLQYELEPSADVEVSRVKKLEREWERLGFGTAKVEEQTLEANAVERLICPPCDEEGRHSLPKALASKRKDPFGDVVVISDDETSHGNFIEISDNSSSKPIKRQRRMNVTYEELHSNHLIHNNQAPCSASRLWQAESPQHYSLLDVSRHSKEHACTNVIAESMEPLDHSHKDGGQQIPLPGCQVQEFLGRKETEEPRLLDHPHLENVLMNIDDSVAAGENHETSKEIRGSCSSSVNSWVACTSIGGDLTNPRISNQKTVSQSYGGAFPIRELEPSSPRLEDFERNLLCIEAPNDNKIDMENKKTGISSEEVAAFPIGKLEPPSSGQKGVKADLMCIEAPNDNKMEINNERMSMSLVAAEGFHLETCTNSTKDIAITSYPECTASSQHHWGQPLEPVSEKSAGPSSLLHPGVMVDTSAFMPLAVPNSRDLSPVFSTTSMLLMPKNKMEIFEQLPQIPHFRKAWNCAPELRQGTALGLMASFADLAESIKKMQIQDEPSLFVEKMGILLDMEEENGFEVGPLKVRLDKLLCTRSCQINLKNRKSKLEKEIIEIEARNCGLEQRSKYLDMLMMGMEEKKYQEMKASLDRQKAENCSAISKLHGDLCQVEESIKNAEADFCSIATVPWQSDVVGPLLP